MLGLLSWRIKIFAASHIYTTSTHGGGGLTKAVPVQTVVMSVPLGHVDDSVSVWSQSHSWVNVTMPWGSHSWETELGMAICP